MFLQGAPCCAAVCAAQILNGTAASPPALSCACPLPPAQSTRTPAPTDAHHFNLQASGAGDGVVRLWQVADAKGGSSKALAPLGGIPARGFVNALALGRSGRVLVAGLGQEPRMGRWLRDPAARNGVLIQPLQLADEGAAAGEDA